MAGTDETIRKMLAAYLARDRAAADALLHERLSFNSPYDANLNKAEYFERCWPGGDAFASMRIDRLFVGGDGGSEGFVRYAIETKDGRKIHNVELIRVEEGRIREVHVYFGEPTK
jgi:ketosteroid isomerase-like protein